MKTIILDGNLYDRVDNFANIVEKNGLHFKVKDNGKLLLFHVSPMSEGQEIIVLPRICDEIGYHAFENSEKNIKGIVGKGVTKIGARAFYGCENLISVDFGPLTQIGEMAFSRCISLEYMPDLSHIDDSNQDGLGNSAFSFCIFKGYVNAAGEKIDGDIFIPKNISKLNETFEYGSMHGVNFEEGGEYVLNKTFASSNIKYCNLFDKTKITGKPNTKVTLLPYAFFETLLTDIYLPDWCELNGLYIFAQSAVKRVTVNTRRIPEMCFTKCRSLSSVEFQNQYANVMPSAFQYCSSLTEVIPFDFGKRAYVGHDAFGGTPYERNVIENNKKKMTRGVYDYRRR